MSAQGKGPRIVDGRWVITGPRVHGGMADVYRAIDAEGEYEKVALKILPSAKATDRYAVKAFEREHRARLAPLDHRNILPLVDGGRDRVPMSRISSSLGSTGS